MQTDQTGNTSSQSPFPWQRCLSWLLVLGMLVQVLVTLILASVPPISRDALNHHLAIPKMYLAHGGIYEIPSMHFSYFPMNLDLLYLLPLWLGFDIGAKYIHYAFALLTAALLYRYLARHLSPIYGAFGALLFIGTPIILKLSVTAYVDLGLIFFSWAALAFVFRWIDSNFSTKNLIAAGIACGLALGTKYNGLITLCIITAMIPLAYSRIQNSEKSSEKSSEKTAKNQRDRNLNSARGLLYGCIFVGTALLVFSPWMLRNWEWKHNPVYPLYNSLFNPPMINTLAPTSAEEEPRNAFWARKNIYKESILQTVTIPIRAFFQGQDDNPKLFDGKLNPALFFLPFFAFLRPNRSAPTIPQSHRNILVGFAGLFMLFVLFSSDFRIRYMAPAIPAIVVLAVVGIHNLWELVTGRAVLIRRIVRLLLVVSITAALLYNGAYVISQFAFIKPFDYLSGQVGRDAYVSRYRVEHSVMVYANKTLPENARVLCLSIGDRNYYLNRKAHLAEDFFDQSKAQSEKSLVEKLRRYGTTHIIRDQDIYLNWSQGLPPDEKAIFDATFNKHTKLLYEANGVQLLQLLDPE